MKQASNNGNRVAIVGTHVGTPETVTDRSLEEMIFAAAQATVADAGIDFEDVEGVVISATDEVDGRVISCMVGSGPAGGVDRDLTTIASASEHALVYGFMRLLSGQGRNVLVLSWGKPSESVAPEHAELVAAEPFVLRPHGINDTVAAALQASVLVAAGAAPAPPSGDGDFVSWPLTRAEARPQGDAVCGALLCVADALPPGATPAWIRGVGWATDRYELGDRDVAALPALRTAAGQAYASAHTEGAAADRTRVHCPSALSLPAAVAALGVPADTARLLDDPDDGPLAYPRYAAGMAAIVRAAQDVRGDRVGGIVIGAATHGFAGQGAAVVVLSDHPLEA